MAQTEHVTHLVRCHHHQIIVPITITQCPLLLHIKMRLAGGREECCDFCIMITFELSAYYDNRQTMSKFTTRAIECACIATFMFLLPETNVQIGDGSTMASVIVVTTSKFIEIETRDGGPNACEKRSFNAKVEGSLKKVFFATQVDPDGLA